MMSPDHHDNLSQKFLTGVETKLAEDTLSAALMMVTNPRSIYRRSLLCDIKSIFPGNRKLDFLELVIWV